MIKRLKFDDFITKEKNSLSCLALGQLVEVELDKNTFLGTVDIAGREGGINVKLLEASGSVVVDRENVTVLKFNEKLLNSVKINKIIKSGVNIEVVNHECLIGKLILYTRIDTVVLTEQKVIGVEIEIDDKDEYLDEREINFLINEIKDCIPSSIMEKHETLLGAMKEFISLRLDKDV